MSSLHDRICRMKTHEEPRNLYKRPPLLFHIDHYIKTHIVNEPMTSLRYKLMQLNNWSSNTFCQNNALNLIFLSKVLGHASEGPLPNYTHVAYCVWISRFMCMYLSVCSSVKSELGIQGLSLLPVFPPINISDLKIAASFTGMTETCQLWFSGEQCCARILTVSGRQTEGYT